MSARLTPQRVAERELWKLTQREERLLGELAAVRDERKRWTLVLDAADPIPEDDQAEE
jgi:hypothetical protein